jgi:hypothetical protein
MLFQKSSLDQYKFLLSKVLKRIETYKPKQWRFKGIWQYIFLLFHFKELLKLYVNLLHRFCVTLLFLEIFWLKIICCPPSWINFYLIGDFSDVISRVSHIKLHLNDQITLSLVWKVVRQFFISNSYWSIWFWAHNNHAIALWIKFLRDPAYDVTCISAKIQDGGKLADLWFFLFKYLKT